MADPAGPKLPPHIEEASQAIARLHAAHERHATPLHRVIKKLTAHAGSPGFSIGLTVVVIGWMALNVGLKRSGYEPIDEPPFFWLQGCVGLAALFMASFILTTQRRDDELSSRREQLMLQLSMLNDQKSAKIIGLLEELRRDQPGVRNRVDQEAAAMAAPADPLSVLDSVTKPDAETS